MAQSLANILIHLVFSTKERLPLIDSSIEPRLHQYICTICENLGSPVVFIGGMPDHVHILFSLSRTITASDLIGKIKANSSRWIKTMGPNYQSFAWQRGYGMFSIGESLRETTIKYIAKQKEHHKTVSFENEFLAFLKKYKMQFDEKQLWD